MNAPRGGGSLEGKSFIFLGPTYGATASWVESEGGRSLVAIGDPDDARGTTHKHLTSPLFHYRHQGWESAVGSLRIGTCPSWLEPFPADANTFVVLPSDVPNEGPLHGRRVIGGRSPQASLECHAESAQLLNELGLTEARPLPVGHPDLQWNSSTDHGGVVLTRDTGFISAGGDAVRICANRYEFEIEMEHLLDDPYVKSIVRAPYVRGESVGMLLFNADDGIAVSSRPHEIVNSRPNGLCRPEFLTTGNTLELSPEQIKELHRQTLLIAEAMRARGHRGVAHVDFVIDRLRAVPHDIGPRYSAGLRMWAYAARPMAAMPLQNALMIGDGSGPIRGVLPLDRASLQAQMDAMTLARTHVPTFELPGYWAREDLRPREDRMRFSRDNGGLWREVSVGEDVRHDTTSVTVTPIRRGRHDTKEWTIAFDDPSTFSGSSTAEVLEDFLGSWSGTQWISSRSELPGRENTLGGLAS